MDNHNLDGHLGSGTEVKGTLRFEGSVRIDGKFTGKVISPATLILGPQALVDGEVEVAEVEVHGALRGQVKASKRATIHASGQVDADITAGSLVVEPGARFNGRCDMQKPAPPKSEAPKAATPPKAGTVPGSTPNSAAAPGGSPKAANASVEKN